MRSMIINMPLWLNACLKIRLAIIRCPNVYTLTRHVSLTLSNVCHHLGMKKMLCYSTMLKGWWKRLIDSSEIKCQSTFLLRELKWIEMSSPELNTYLSSSGYGLTFSLVTHQQFHIIYHVLSDKALFVQGWLCDSFHSAAGAQQNHYYDPWMRQTAYNQETWCGLALPLLPDKNGFSLDWAFQNSIEVELLLSITLELTTSFWTSSSKIYSSTTVGSRVIALFICCSNSTPPVA